jgi:hypothetical protein
VREVTETARDDEATIRAMVDAGAFEHVRPCIPVPHEPHWDEYGDCPGFVGPEERCWSEEG